MQDLVRVRDVMKSYRLGETRVPALRGVSLTIGRGEVVALIGPSGSGKSTLLHLIGGIDDPDAGQVLWEGRDLATLSLRERSRLRNETTSFVFQTFNLIPVLSVVENVELPLLINALVPPGERRVRALAAIDDVGLTEYRDQLPDRLSGGQRQRVAIARALAGGPMLILADEPTANLDSETARHIVDLMLEMNAKRGVTLLFATHDEKLMAKVRRMITVRDGKVAS